MLNRRQFSTYLGLTLLGLVTVWRMPQRQVFYTENVGAVRLDQGTVQVQVDDDPLSTEFVKRFQEGINILYEQRTSNLRNAVLYG